MTEVLTSLINFFLWNNVGKVDRHFVQEGDIWSGERELNRIGVRRLDALHRCCRAVHEFLRALDAQEEARAWTGSFGIQNARDRVDHIVCNELTPIMELDAFTDLEGVG